jgi:hypothetical protein
MSKFTLFLFSAVCVAAFAPGRAMAQQSFRDDMPFFEQKAAEYQQWLREKGLGSTLRVDKVQFKTTKTGTKDYSEVELLLLVNSFDVDTAIAQWTQLKRAFDSPADTLEHFLYRDFVHKMEIPAAQGNIQIYVKNRRGEYSPCFHVWIWVEKGRTFIEKKVGECKAKAFEVTVSPPRPVATGRSKTAKVSKPRTPPPHEVFNTILLHVRESMLDQARYRTELNDRKPRIESDSLRTATTFRFTVANLGKEVLTDQTRSVWERWVRINTIAMERLTFQFEYQPAAAGAYNLKCTIDGKYGSGIFKPRTTGYMNMETDFDDFFERYKDNFRNALIKRLQ